MNDISGLRYEPDLAGVVARRRAAIVLMHTRGRSRDMYKEAVYHEVVDEVLDELRESVAFATGAGIPPDRIIVDPGLGFAKEAAHTYEALARLDEFSELGRPLLVGPSRKRFLTRPARRCSGQAAWRCHTSVGARLGHGGCGGRCRVRRRAHRARARGARDERRWRGSAMKFGSIIAADRGVRDRHIKERR